MARAGQQVLREDGRLEDRISVGVLAMAFPREAVEQVIDAAGAREQRNRMLPAWLTVYFVLALALFMDIGAGRVMRRLAGTLAWAVQGITVTIPSEEALSNARARLGAEPLRLLFEKTAGLLAPAGTPGAFWRGLHLVSLDGTTVDLQDTEANWEHFGGPSTRDASGTGLRGAFPQARLLALAECGTRALVAAVRGSYCQRGEDADQPGCCRACGRGMLVLADRNFAGYELWRDSRGDRGAAAVAHRGVLQPAGASGAGRRDMAVGPEGPPRAPQAGAADITVRVIEYRLEDDAGQVTETFTLITTLLDPAQAPARELAELYHARWEIETALGAFKSDMKGAGVVLRSKTPDGATQEIWALLCASRHPRDDLRRRSPRRPRPAADLFRQRSGHRTRPGRRPTSVSPLTSSSAPHWPSSAPSPAGPGPAGTTPATPSAATATRPRPPTRQCARSRAGRSPWSCCPCPSQLAPNFDIAGPTRTEGTAPVGEASRPAARGRPWPDVQALLGEIAEAIVSLASSRSSFVTARSWRRQRTHRRVLSSRPDPRPSLKNSRPGNA